MKKNFKILTFTGIIIFVASLLYVYSTNTSNDIIKIDSFAQAQDALKLADQNTLVLFDIDDTLIIPSSVIIRTRTAIKSPWVQPIIKAAFESFLKNRPFESLVCILATEDAPLLIESPVVETIKSLQDRGVKVLALTNLSTGACDKIEYVPGWRFKQLQNLGIDFNKVNMRDITFTQLGQDGSFPILYHGILATNGVSKDKVLGAFLDSIHWKPAKIIFFDDNIERINEVEQEACKRNIRFLGYHYLGAEHVSGEPDENIINLQFKYLLNNEKWLSDDDALKMLQNMKTQI